MQAVGLVNYHTVSCFRHSEIELLRALHPVIVGASFECPTRDPKGNAAPAREFFCPRRQDNWKI
jgi:hypothetical protein